MLLEAVILSYKPDTRLIRLVEKLKSQVIRPERIHIMLTLSEGVSKESVFTMVSGGVVITEINKNDFSHGLTRQKAADMSPADYILFMTQDAIPYDNMMTTRLLNSLKNESAAVAYARQMPYKNANSVETFSRQYNYPKKSRSQVMPEDGKLTAKSIFCSDTCAMYKMSIFRSLKGFSDVDFNEDAIFAFKAITNGYSIEYCSNAICYHSHNYTIKQLFTRYKANARTQKNTPEVYGNISNESEGMNYLRSGISYFSKRKKYLSVFRLIFESMIKYSGYFIGRYTGL